jgi:HD-like signal output (HDOD) protein
MEAQRPVAAQVVAMSNGEDTSAAELARVLAADVALASRVVKLANSAYYGMRGRVSSLQFAVTVVGFTTVRTMATVALTDLTDQSRLPEDFWTVSTKLALAASGLGPRFDVRPQDGLCLGLLAQLGVALLYQDDPDGYRAVCAAESRPAERRAAEVARYGIHALRLTAVALEQWTFPKSMVGPLQHVEDPTSIGGGLLRCAFEVVGRSGAWDVAPSEVGPLSCGRLREEDVAPVVAQVDADLDELYRALLG